MDYAFKKIVANLLPHYKTQKVHKKRPYKITSLLLFKHSKQ